MQLGTAATSVCAHSTSAACAPNDLAPVGKGGPSVLRYRSIWHCFMHTLRVDGPRAFYISYPTTLTMAIPFQSIHFASYEYIRPLLQPAFRNFTFASSNASTEAYSPMTHIVSGGIAGATAAAFTNPLDVAKTLLQTRGVSACNEVRNCPGLISAVRIVYKREGLRGFSRGMRARVVAHMPATAICWGVYEYFKWILGNRDLTESAIYAKSLADSSL
jgi:solute carrier family 25 iron transporter 28/37